MWRVVRLAVPEERYRTLADAARVCGFNAFDYYVDVADTEFKSYYWVGDGNAVALMMFDDLAETADQVAAAFTRSYASLGGDTEDVTVGKTFVCWPDGCTSELYHRLDGPTARFHELDWQTSRTAAEDAEHQQLYAQLTLLLTHAVEQGEAALSSFVPQVKALLGIPSEA